KFTEVGYVGRDVESMIRDLTESAVDMVRREKQAEVHRQAEANVEEQLLDLLLPPTPARGPSTLDSAADEAARAAEQSRSTREKLRSQLRSGSLDTRSVEIEVREKSFPGFQILSSQGVEEMDINVKDLMPGLFGNKTKRRRLSIPEARAALVQEELGRLVDAEQVAHAAVDRVQNSGILFIDEIDKIAGREGVHGDILPIVEGTTVSTKYGPVRTDHILFIAAGAFHVSKPADLIPELQG